MGFFKTLFGGKDESAEEQKENKARRDFDVLKYDGVKALRIHQPEQAIRCLRAALELKDDLQTHDYLSQAYLQNNEMGPALEELSLLAEAEPENTGILLRMAQVDYIIEDYDAMGEACTKALAADASAYGALLLMARARLGQHRTDEALEALNQAIGAAPDFADARLLRADTLLKEKRTDEANADAEWLTQHAPDDEDVLMLNARLEREQGHAAEAIIYYNKVTETNPFCAEAFRERAEVKLAQGDRAGYDDDMARMLDIDPSQAQEDIEQKMQQAYRNVNPFG